MSDPKGAERPAPLQPVSWRREWDGDVSDEGLWVHADDESELDRYGPWEALFAEEDVRTLERQRDALLERVKEAERERNGYRHSTEVNKEWVDYWQKRAESSLATLTEIIEHHEGQIEELNRKYLDRSGEVFALQDRLATLKEPMRRAAEILCEEAESTRSAHTVDGEWDGTEPEAQAAHDEMIEIAEALSAPVKVPA